MTQRNPHGQTHHLRKQEQKQFSVMLRDKEAHATALKLQKTLTDDMPFGSVTIGEAVAYDLQFTLENRK